VSETSRVRLTLQIPAGEDPPTAFRVFTAGVNETSKGRFLFDGEAALAVMREFESHGADLMIDLEHLSLDQDGPNYDPDARGWCRLEVVDGELWAVGVTWTSDGAVRLREKRQRYVSPVLDFDPKTRRVLGIHNIAITATPATHQPAALVAASKRAAMAADAGSMSGLERLGLGPDATLDEIVAAISDLQSKLNPEPEGDEAGAMMADAAGAPVAEEEKKQAAAMSKALAPLFNVSRELGKLTNEKTPKAALSAVERWRSAYLEMAEQREKLAKEAKKLEQNERIELCRKAVLSGLEPAVAWDDLEAEKPSKLAEPFASMPIDQFRGFVAKLASKPKPKNAEPPKNPNHKAPTERASFSINGHTVELDARELKICADTKCDPAVFAARKYPNGRQVA
jgi:phage I-like protein